jgi:hypothetical protein
MDLAYVDLHGKTADGAEAQSVMTAMKFTLVVKLFFKAG